MRPEQGKVDVRRSPRIDQLLDGTELLAGGLHLRSWGLAAFGAVLLEHVSDGLWNKRDEFRLCSDVDHAGQLDPLGGGADRSGQAAEGRRAGMAR